MLGAIAGDIIGSVYEAWPIKTKAFELFGPGSTFTDDSVCTVAIAEWLLSGGDPAVHLRRWTRLYPGAGYGAMFFRWAMTDGMGAYGSWGNGSAMRVSPVAWVARDEDEVFSLARQSSEVTHDHRDAVAGAQAAALAGWLALQGVSASEIMTNLAERFGYDLATTVDAIRPGYRFDVSARGTVPAAIVCAMEARDYEAAARNAVSLGGDSDTLACIAGGIAEARFGIPAGIAEAALARLDAPLAEVVGQFAARYGSVVPPEVSAHPDDVLRPRYDRAARTSGSDWNG